jgi:peptidoglycan/LPS O-acetylase OafA/YrhL
VNRGAAAPAAPAKSQHGRIVELDGIRGIAILLVLLTHLFSYSMMGKPWTGVAAIVMRATVPGWLGVDLFFVLSGFLITGILVDSRQDIHYFRNFYARRALRILPLYLLVLLILGIFYTHSAPFVILSLLFSANMADLFGVTVVSGGAALWSLAVEEHFYLIFPWVIRFADRRALTWIAMSICAFEPLLRFLFRSVVNDVYFYSWFRFDGLAWGALIALYVRSGWFTTGRAVAVAGIAVLFSLTAAILGSPAGLFHRATGLGAAFEFTVPQIAFAAAVLFAVAKSGSGITAPFRWRTLTLFGDLSYCMYVTHNIILDGLGVLASKFVDVDQAMYRFDFIVKRAIVGLVVCMLVALVSRRYFELPILKLRRYFASSSPG